MKLEVRKTYMIKGKGPMVYIGASKNSSYIFRDENKKLWRVPERFIEEGENKEDGRTNKTRKK